MNLLTYHAAKGLEFEAVFLPRLEEGDLPIRQARSPDAVDEERRLLYVGITRAKRHLSVTWSGSGKRSRFLRELGAAETVAPSRRRPDATEEEEPAFRALRTWRLERAKADGVPAYVVFHDATLAEIVRRAPGSHGELAEVPGVGPAKLARYADEVLDALRAAIAS